MFRVLGKSVVDIYHVRGVFGNYLTMASWYLTKT